MTERQKLRLDARSQVEVEVEVDRERCVGAGQCVLAAEAVFDQDSTDGRVLLLEPPPGGHARTDVEQAVRECPSGAITVTPARSPT
nr:ferredoxin [Streptomyces sp. SID3343]